jgi:hypothetical protein
MKVVDSCKEHLLPKVYLNIKDNSTIVSDTYHAYRDLKKHYNHKTVKHSAGEYCRNEKDNDIKTAFKVHTNSIEGFWSLLKRGINGIYHWASVKHIQGYINEFSYRYSTKELQGNERFLMFLNGVENKKVTYKQLIGC